MFRRAHRTAEMLAGGAAVAMWLSLSPSVALAEEAPARRLAEEARAGIAGTRFAEGPVGTGRLGRQERRAFVRLWPGSCFELVVIVEAGAAPIDATLRSAEGTTLAEAHGEGRLVLAFCTEPGRGDPRPTPRRATLVLNAGEGEPCYAFQLFAVNAIRRLPDEPSAPGS